jgi:hypothetical protein
MTESEQPFCCGVVLCGRETVTPAAVTVDGVAVVVVGKLPAVVGGSKGWEVPALIAVVALVVVAVLLLAAVLLAAVVVAVLLLAAVLLAAVVVVVVVVWPALAFGAGEPLRRWLAETMTAITAHAADKSDSAAWWCED